MAKFYEIKSRDHAGRWRPLRSVPPSTDLVALIAKVRTFDQDGLFSPSYKIVDEDGKVVASYTTHSHG